MNLLEDLILKASNQKLGHFYILETSNQESKSFEILYTFIETFIQDYYSKVEKKMRQNTSLKDFADVFVMGNTIHEIDDKKEKFFKVEEAEEMNRFFEFRPVEGERKFAVITESHRINTIIANKWLKLFEEPLGESTIFLLNPRRSQLLPTIHSRAIHLRLPKLHEESTFDEWTQLILDCKNLTLSKFLEDYSRNSRPLLFWVNELIRWESEQMDQATSKEELQKWLKSFYEMETFNQPSATKWVLFFSYLQKHVLPRESASNR